MKTPDKIFGKLEVFILPTREAMGKAAAENIAEKIQSVLNTKGTARMIFAAAPSQNEMLHELCQNQEIDWSSIVAFHMDEYLGLADDAPQLFGSYLRKHIFEKVPFQEVHFLNANPTDISNECKRYSNLINEAPIDIICMGIGENGHIAFNDPPVANFDDPETVKAVELDLDCRQQQVNDGCFSKIEYVPTHALTLTVPALMSAQKLCIVVPGKLKANAVHNSLYGEITTDCPASVLRTHPNAALFLESESASKLKVK